VDHSQTWRAAQPHQALTAEKQLRQSGKKSQSYKKRCASQFYHLIETPIFVAFYVGDYISSIPWWIFKPPVSEAPPY
jgi:hypothetical protein